MPRPIMWLIGMKLRVIDGWMPLVTPGPPDRPSPRIGDQPFGVHRALWCSRAPRGVDEQRQRVVVVGDERLYGGKFGPAPADVRQGFNDDATTGVGQSRLGGFERLAMVIDLRQVVEHDQARRREAGEDQFGCVAEIVDARGDDGRFRLGDDRSQLRDGRACLQRHGDRTKADQRDVDGCVVDTGEAQQRNTVAGADGVAGQRVGDRLDACGELAIGDGLEAGE